ncbi:hypothetical protein SAMN02745866_00999 [Alteromonadaceae bacterium Bs31]|nr:hypothetical protein SAMN02745866_00999 [Alteromonadaceae bacterium Bs31]
MFNTIVYDHFGGAYVFTQSSAPNSQTLSFSDITYARQFLRKLDIASAELEAMFPSLLDAPYSGPETFLDKLAHLLCQGRLKVAEYAAIERLKKAGSVTFRRGTGSPISILPAAAVASDGTAAAAKPTVSYQKAKAIIEELEMSDEQAQALVSELKIPAAAGQQASVVAAPPNAAPASVAPAKEQLAQAVADGQVVIEEQPRRPKASEKSSAEPANTAGTRRADKVAPEPAAAAVQQQAKEEEEPECKLTKLTVMCNHDGRKQEVTAATGTTLELDVVASETNKRGFEKIKATVDTSAPCGSHTQSSSSIFPAPEKTEKGSLENTYHLACKPIRNPFKVLWLHSIDPSRYNIKASSCDSFRPAAVNVNVFPKVSWSASVSYGLGSAESASGNPAKPYSFENKPAAFKGKVEYNYDEKKEDLALTYKREINQVLKKFDWVKNKLDYFLRKISDGKTPVQLEIAWPSFSLTYKAALEEDKAKPVVKSTHELAFAAAPLLGLKGTVDLFPIILKASKANPAAAPIVAILEAAMEGVGNDKSVASLQADISLKFSIGTAVNINFSAKGANGEDDKDVKSEQSLNLEFQLEGTVGAKGHIWVIKFEKSYKAGMKTGFVGKVVITRDEVGYYWYSRFLFNGLIVYFTKYEKLEKSVGENEDAADLFDDVPDDIENSSTTEWTWIEPDPDEEATDDTVTDPGTPQAQENNRHYLVRF